MLIESNLLRRMSSNRVRSRFLRGGIARASKDGTDEEAKVAETLLNWWELRSKMVLQWIENNPLLLGISREAVCLIKEQIARGSIAGTPDATRRKIWAHTYVELVSVPGLPTNLVSLSVLADLRAVAMTTRPLVPVSISFKRGK